MAFLTFMKASPKRSWEITAVFTESYMRNGDASNVSYPYWHPQRASDPCLLVASSRLTGETIECLVRLDNMPLVHEVLGRIFSIRRNPEPQAVGKAYNFSNMYLKE